MKERAIVIAFTLACACGKGEPAAGARSAPVAEKTTAQPANDGLGNDDCARAVRATRAFDMPGGTRRKSDRKDVLPDMRIAMAQSCRTTKWSPEVIACFETAKSRDGVEACDKTMTPEQSTAMAEAMLAAMRDPAKPTK